MLSQVAAATINTELSTLYVQSSSQVESSPTGRYFIFFEGPSALQKTKANKGQVQSALVQNEVAGIRAAQVQQLKRFEKLLGRKLTERKHFDLILNAVALALSLEEAGLIAVQPGVKNVVPVKMAQLATDAGPTWVGAPLVWEPTLPSSFQSMGEGVVIGVLDTGINFDHPSFASDPAISGYVFPTPSHYYGVCQSITGFCNDKVIGAYYMSGGTGLAYNILPEDTNGHGSHTTSIVAGNTISLPPTISGMAPHAQLIAYDVCHSGNCSEIDLAAGIQQAIDDGVDVINYSISSDISPFIDPIEIAFLDAFEVGIFVSASAGNYPRMDHLSHQAPWVSTIAATSHNLRYAPGPDVRGIFSYQGPASFGLEILKPDLAAPGVQIVAACADGSLAQDYSMDLAYMSGTSMSTPFVAGAAALLISAHPEWTPAEVKSALMLTAKTDGVYKNDVLEEADPFDIGAGRIQVDQAIASGLVMDETAANMAASNPAHGGDPKTLNLPSMQNNYCWPSCSWTRTVGNATTFAQTYEVTSPDWIAVEPSQFTIAPGAFQNLKITAQTDSKTMHAWEFAQIDLTPNPNPKAIPTLHLTAAVFTTQLIYYYFPYLVK